MPTNSRWENPCDEIGDWVVEGRIANEDGVGKAGFELAIHARLEGEEREMSECGWGGDLEQKETKGAKGAGTGLGFHLTAKSSKNTKPEAVRGMGM